MDGNYESVETTLTGEELLKREPRTFCLKCGWVGTPSPFLKGWLCGNPECGYMVLEPYIAFTLSEWAVIQQHIDDLTWSAG